LSVLVYYLNKKVPELNLLNNPIEIISIFTLILLLSILITTISSFFATKKFLRLKSEII
jgi:cell division transport system permease protein